MPVTTDFDVFAQRYHENNGTTYTPEKTAEQTVEPLVANPAHGRERSLIKKRLSDDPLISDILRFMRERDQYNGPDLGTLDTTCCPCRVWKGQLRSNQCTRKPAVGGMCKIHNNHLEKHGAWHFGLVGGRCPEKWGDICDYVPGDRERGKTIPWKG